MVTNLKEHWCDKIIGMAYITFNKRLQCDDGIFYRSGFELELIERKKEGKLVPKVYTIKCPIDYCPFCSEQLKATPHLESCDCILCSTQKALRKVAINVKQNVEVSGDSSHD